nr:hypothetical protein LKV13_04970 [Borrelia sp. BU AG58]
MKKINIIFLLILAVALLASCDLVKRYNGNTIPEHKKAETKIRPKTDEEALRQDTTGEVAEANQQDAAAQPEADKEAVIQDAAGDAEKVKPEAAEGVAEANQQDAAAQSEADKEAPIQADSESSAGGEAANQAANQEVLDKTEAERVTAEAAEKAEEARAASAASARAATEAAKAAAEATEAEKAFNAFKARVGRYKRGLEGLKTKFNKLASKNEVLIPAQVRGIKDADREKIHSSLGYSNIAHKDLNEAIAALKLSVGSKDEEIEVATNVLKVLVDFDDQAQIMFNGRLKDENLETIKDDRSGIEGTVKEFDAFIKARSAFIKSVQRILRTAVSKKNDARKVKEELSKITQLVTQF